jgi:hypothetical protein
MWKAGGFFKFTSGVAMMQYTTHSTLSNAAMDHAIIHSSRIIKVTFVNYFKVNFFLW